MQLNPRQPEIPVGNVSNPDYCYISGSREHRSKRLTECLASEKSKSCRSSSRRRSIQISFSRGRSLVIFLFPARN